MTQPDNEPSAPDLPPAALRASEERLRMAVEAGGVGIWDWDIARDHVTWSDVVYALHGMEPGSDTGGVKGFRARVHPEDRERVEAAMAAALAGGPPYAVEFRALIPGGRIRWISTHSRLLKGEDGRPLRMVGASMDVTDRVELLAAERSARADAEASRQRLELLAKAGAELARSLDPQDTLRAIATTLVPGIADWCRIDLLDDDGVLQRRLAWHSDPAWAQKALDMALRMRAAVSTTGSMAWVVANKKPYYGHYDSPESIADPVLREYTNTFGMRATFIVPLLARGRIIGAMAAIQAESGRDLSEGDRTLIQELAQRAGLALDNARLYAEAETNRHQAEMANRAKDEFLAMLGHELRNPLAPIVTALDLMARREPEAVVGERRTIGRQVAHLSRLIDDLLDISRITQGKITLQNDSVDLKVVVANALELTQPVFEKHLHPVELRIDASPAPATGDAVRLTQVLCNLLVNAAKFTPRDGRVVLELKVAGRQAEISVRDSGSGISAELLPRVFDMFIQGRQSIDRQAGGLGLGLAIVRTLVEMHGGSVSGESEGLGRGSCFTVRLPLSESQAAAPVAPGAPAAPAAPAVEPPVASSGKVLIVDDNSDAAETLSDLLGVVGYEAKTAGSGPEAMELLENFLPQLALLDIGLPGIDGYQLAGMLRADPRTSGMRLVALTGYGRDNDRARAMEAGFDEHLVKPVSVERLLQVLGEQLSTAQAA